MAGTLVYDLLIILSAGLLAGLVCRRVQVSVLVGYLVVGALLGAGVLGWVRDEHHEIEHLAEAGVFLLLFSIGLEFSLEELLRLGRNLLVGGSVQMLLVAVPVAGLMTATGAAWQPALLIAAATAFSSTVLVFKALAESGHSGRPHGRRAIGILLFQDAALVPLLLLVPLLTQSDEAAGIGDLIRLVLTSAGFVAAVVLLRRLLAQWLIPLMAGYRSPDLVVLFALVVLGGVTMAAFQVGLPPAIGAFAAGLAFSGNRWSHQIDALVLPFREAFAAVFFVSLGLLFDPQTIFAAPLLWLACLAGLVVLKAAAASAALRLTGLDNRSSLGMGIGLAHVGEFAFVLLLIGAEAGVVPRTEYQRIVSLAIGSLLLTPFLMRLGLRWVTETADEAAAVAAVRHNGDGRHQAVVVGAGPVGRQLASQLETTGHDVCLVDLSPINLHPFATEGFRTVAGDGGDEETLRSAHADEATLAVLCVPDDAAAERTLRALRAINPECFVLVRCRYHANEPTLRKHGADRVISEETVATGALMRILAEMS